MWQDVFAQVATKCFVSTQVTEIVSRYLLTEWKHHLRPSFFFKYQVENGVFVANPLQERTILMRKEGESAKSINEMLLSRLSRYRASPSATLAALTGSTISNTLKEDQAGALSPPDHLYMVLRLHAKPTSPSPPCPHSGQ